MGAVLCVWVTVSVGVHAAQPTSAFEVPRPDLSAMDGVVRQRVEGTQLRLDSMLAAYESGAPSEGLGAAFGELGRLFHAFRLRDAAEVCYENARQLAPDDYRWSYHLGLILNERGDLVESIDSYERALKLEPGDVPTQIRLGDVLLEVNRPDEAEHHFSAVLSLRSQEVAAISGLGKVAERRGETAASIRLFEKALELQPEAGSLHYPLAQAYRRLGQLEEARAHLALHDDQKVRFTDPLGSEVLLLAEATAFEIVLSLARDSRSVSEAEFLGFALGQFGEKEGTIEQLEAGLILERYSGRQTAPQEMARIHFVLGGLLVNDSRDDEAIEHFEAAIDLDSEVVEPRIKLGNAHARAGRFSEAAVAYESVVKAHPDNSAALLKQAAALQSSQRFAEARAPLESLLRLDPTHSEALVRLGTVLEQLGDFATAVDLYRSATRLDLALAETVRIRFVLAGLLRRQGALGESLQHYQWILGAEPGYVPAIAELAGLQGQLGNFDESAALYSRWSDAEPRRTQPWIGRATALIAAGRNREARFSLQDGLLENPDSLAVKGLLARHLAACPDHSVRDGRQALPLAIEVYGEAPSTEALETLATAYAEVGEFAEATLRQEELVAAVADEADPVVLRQLRANLERYRQDLKCCEGEDDRR